MADIGLVDAALVEVLTTDAALTALCPDGVYWDLRPSGAPAPEAFVIVSHFDYRREPGLADDTLYERILYWVVARIRSTSRTPARQAAARIDALLNGAILDLTPAGYTAMACSRVDRRSYLESDPANQSTWHHHGGQYEVWGYPT